MNRRHAIAALLAQFGGLATLGSLARPAAAQSPFPSLPITVIAGFAPGGGTDIIARFYAQKLSERLSVPVVVQNRTGAGGNIAIQALINAPADGYTLVLGGSYIAINAAFKRNPYDWEKDLSPIGVAGLNVNLVTVASNSKITSIEELISAGRTAREPLTYGSPGVGSASHVAGEIFKVMTGANMLHVPYRGIAPAEMDLMAGNIDLLFGNISSAARHVESGRLRALATTGAERASTFPDLPTVSEAGVPGYTSITSMVFLARSGTPASIITQLNDEISQIAKDPETIAYLRDIHTEAKTGDAQFARKILSDEQEQLDKLLKDVEIKFD